MRHLWRWMGGTIVFFALLFCSFQVGQLHGGYGKAMLHPMVLQHFVGRVDSIDVEKNSMRVVNSPNDNRFFAYTPSVEVERMDEIEIGDYLRIIYTPSQVVPGVKPFADLDATQIRTIRLHMSPDESIPLEREEWESVMELLQQVSVLPAKEGKPKTENPIKFDLVIKNGVTINCEIAAPYFCMKGTWYESYGVPLHTLESNLKRLLTQIEG